VFLLLLIVACGGDGREAAGLGVIIIIIIIIIIFKRNDDNNNNYYYYHGWLLRFFAAGCCVFFFVLCGIVMERKVGDAGASAGWRWLTPPAEAAGRVAILASLNLMEERHQSGTLPFFNVVGGGSWVLVVRFERQPAGVDCHVFFSFFCVIVAVYFLLLLMF